MANFITVNGRLVDVDPYVEGAENAPTPILFRRNNVITEVNEDTVNPSNNSPLPVKLTGVTGDVNITAGDLNVQTSHSGVNYDSIRLGDGNNLPLYINDGDSDTSELNPSFKVGGQIQSDISSNALANDSRQSILLDTKGRLYVKTQDSINVDSSVADNDVDSGNPIKVGAKAKTPTSMPTYVANDRSSLHTDLNGRLITLDETLRKQDIADNAVDAGNPIKMGAKAKSPTAMPTYVANDRANLHTDLNGRLISVDENLRKQDVADNSLDVGNPIKVGGKVANVYSMDGWAVGYRVNAHFTTQGALFTQNNVLWRSNMSDTNVTNGILDASINNIPAINATNALQLFSSAGGHIARIRTVEDIGEFMGLFNSATGTAAFNQICVLPLGGGVIDAYIAPTQPIYIRSMTTSPVVVGKICIELYRYLDI